MMSFDQGEVDGCRLEDCVVCHRGIIFSTPQLTLKEMIT